MTRLLAFPLALLLSTLTACGGEGAAPSTDAPAANAPEVSAAPAAAATGCPWLTSEAASEALGAAVTVTGDGQDECNITSEPNTYGARIYVDPTPLGNTLDNIIRPYENTAGYGARQPISGLGEQAALVGNARPTGGYGGVRLGVEQGGRTVTIQLTPATTQEDVPAKAEALARAIVAQL